MKLVIIGGVAGGASAAARARRIDENAQIVMFERGEHISFANCGLPYHVGGVIEKKEDLLVMPSERFKARANVEIRTAHEVTSIDPAAKTLSVTDRRTGASLKESYDKLIIATGSTPRKPDIPGIDDPDVLTIWNMSDMIEVMDRVNDGIKRAVVVGGGYIGLEMAENFTRRNIQTVIVQRSDQLMRNALDPEMAKPIAETLRLHGVKIIFNNTVKSIQRKSVGSKEEKTDLSLALSDGSTLQTDIVLVAAGIRPNSELAAQAGLALGKNGGIAVNEYLQTSNPDIYAAGDAIQVVETVLGAPAQIPLAGPANRQGRAAAENALRGNRIKFKGSIGTSICKIFNLTMASAGPTEKALKGARIKFKKLYLNPFSHATYYPGAKQMHMKMLFSPDGKVLGAQIVGTDGVKERIDVLAAAISSGMSVYDLQDLELAYAPPYGSAKEPVNYAGFVAVNMLEGMTSPAYPDEIPESALLLDVREEAEFRKGHIDGARLIPLGRLRSSMAELPKDKEIIVYCQVGIRGYIAERILRQNGFNVRNLSGGYVTWRMFQR